jgi:hypothetical protein
MFVLDMIQQRVVSGPVSIRTREKESMVVGEKCRSAKDRAQLFDATQKFFGSSKYLLTRASKHWWLRKDWREHLKQCFASLIEDLPSLIEVHSIGASSGMQR